MESSDEQEDKMCPDCSNNNVGYLCSVLREPSVGYLRSVIAYQAKTIANLEAAYCREKEIAQGAILAAKWLQKELDKHNV